MDSDWRSTNERRIVLAGEFLAQNDQLTDLLQSNMESADFNRYNLEVYLSIAGLYRQNLVMIEEVGSHLRFAEGSGRGGHTDSEKAVAALDQALGIAENIRQARNEALGKCQRHLV